MTQGSFIAKRVVLGAVTVVVAVTMNFFIFRLAPGNPVDRFAHIPGITRVDLHNLEVEFGINKPILQQYFAYLRALARGDLGRSFADDTAVSSDLWHAYLNTAPMVLIGLIVAMLFGILTGAVSAWRRNTAVDHGLLSSALVLYALPAQWLGLMLLFLFSGWLPVGGQTDPFVINPTFWQHIADLARHLILPSLTLGLVLYGQYTLVVRSSLLETLSDDYVLTARAKGLTDTLVLRRHALRNALLPTTSLIALSLTFVVSGAILVEAVFSWPGIGLAIYKAVLDRDWPMLQGAFLVVTISVVVLNLIADVVYSWLDPRVTA